MKITAKKLMMALIPYGFIILYRHYKNSKNANYEKAFTWIMTENEQKLFKEYIRNAKIYLEFGSGGSTIVALNSVEGKIYSVESSKDWIETIRQKYDIIEKAVTSGRLKLLYADIGETGEWGWPIITGNENDKDRFLNYSQKVFEEHPEIKLADVVLIDGRFRVACCLSALLRNDVKTTYMFHDFWNSPKYHIIKKFVTIIDGVDRLMVYRKNPVSSDDEIMKEYENYKYNCE